jgi:Tol biopolymer transport system component
LFVPGGSDDSLRGGDADVEPKGDRSDCDLETGEGSEHHNPARAGPSTGRFSGEPAAESRERAADEVPSWSPDGARLSFASNRDGNWEIYMMTADGGD